MTQGPKQDVHSDCSQATADYTLIVEYIIGIVLALVISFAAKLAGLDRDGGFYPMLLAVIASYYVLFAVMGGSVYALIVESLVMAVFLLIAILGFKFELWLVVVALAGHGVLGFVHANLISNPGAPVWWPPFCLAYDLSAAGFLAWLLRHSASRAAGESSPSKDST